MLPLEIDQVDFDHIAALVTEKVAERKILEYKERLPDGTDGGKKEFLADVCSFANSSGGDIIFGIRDQKDSNGRATGVPETIVGLSDINLSAERERMESIIRDGIRPRVPGVQTRDFAIQGHRSVVLLRIGRSWIRPHMVTYAGTSRFYSRHSTGKYQLDVQEIGQAFAEQRSLGEQLRRWRQERLARILSGESPVPLEGPSILLVHFLPASALAGQQLTSAWPVPSNVKALFRPSSLTSATSWRYNADGFLAYSPQSQTHSAAYVQQFRNGCLEYADGYILNAGRIYGAGRENGIPSKAFEQKLVEVFGNAVLVLSKFGIDDPVYFSCALIGVQGQRLSRASLFEFGTAHAFDRPIVETPEVQIDRADSRPYRSSVLPVVDAIWQANGYEQTPWRNQSGEWDPYLN